MISDKFVLLGASAGGHLSLLHAYKYTTPVKIKAVVDFFGPTDLVDMYNNPASIFAPPAAIAAVVGGYSHHYILLCISNQALLILLQPKVRPRSSCRAEWILWYLLHNRWLEILNCKLWE